jgi:hypothetical protein
MASNIPALRTKKQQELALVESEILDIDLPAEQALMDQAQATFDASPAQAAFKKASNRWATINGIFSRREELVKEIALFTAG